MLTRIQNERPAPQVALQQWQNNELDLGVFDQRYKSDATGAPAYDPAILLKNG